MTSSALRVRSEEATPEATTFYLEGDLYGTHGGYAFQEAVLTKFQAGRKTIIIDLGGVERIDSCGIGILAACVVSAKNSQGQLVLSAVGHRVEKLLDLVWPLDFVTRAASTEEALAQILPR